MGRVESGSVRVGDEVAVLPGGHATRIRDIRAWKASARIARRHDNVTLFVDDPIDIARGDMLVRKDDSRGHVEDRRGDALLARCGAARSRAHVPVTAHDARRAGTRAPHRLALERQ